MDLSNSLKVCFSIPIYKVQIIQIKEQFTVETSADKVWEVLGHNFDSVADWDSNVYVSQGNTSDRVLLNTPYSGRVCETVIGRFDETITRYDEGEKVVSYIAKGDKMPFFINQSSNIWTVIPLSDDKCQVEMCMEVSLLPVFNIIMAPMMRMQLSGVVKNVIEELKYFAEKGVAHPRKVEAQQKYQLKAT
ncbi:MAG: SRPBCC family protein [Rivularia sp. (in: cyanobacteria)]